MILKLHYIGEPTPPSRKKVAASIQNGTGQFECVAKKNSTESFQDKAFNLFQRLEALSDNANAYQSIGPLQRIPEQVYNAESYQRHINDMREPHQTGGGSRPNSKTGKESLLQQGSPS